MNQKKISQVHEKLKKIKKLTILKQYGNIIIANHDDLYESDSQKLSSLHKLIQTKTKAKKIIIIPLKPSQRLITKVKHKKK